MYAEFEVPKSHTLRPPHLIYTFALYLIKTRNDSYSKYISPHSGAQPCTCLVSCLINDWHAAAGQTARPYSSLGLLQISNAEYGSVVETLMLDAPDFTVNWFRTRTIWWLQVCGNEVQYRVYLYLMSYCMP